MPAPVTADTETTGTSASTVWIDGEGVPGASKSIFVITTTCGLVASAGSYDSLSRRSRS